MKYLKGLKKLSTLTGWKQFFKVLSPKEKSAFSLFLFLFIVSSAFLSINFYLENSEIKPTEGGKYIEGVVGSPRYINPVYAETSDVDRDLVELIFSGLMKYDPEGNLQPNLAESYKIFEEGKVYEFYLKENLFWSDGHPLTANDVVFTVKTIQNPEIKSPLRVNWLGVEAEKISNPFGTEGSAVRFRLSGPSAVFLENCTLKIIPEHLWKNVSAQNFPLTIQNLKPIGSGPFQLKKINQNEEGEIISLELVRNPKYPEEGPNLSQITFYFFKNEEDLIKSYQKKEIEGLSPASLKNISLQNDYNLYSFSLPRYFAVFFNLNPPDGGTEVLTEKEVRQALNYGVNKEEILKEVLKGKGEIAQSPILPEIYGFNPPAAPYEFNPEKAKEVLKNSGFVESQNGKLVKIVKKEPAFQFKSNLKVGSQGTEVKELQKCLANPPAGGPEIYPEGETSGYLGQKTKEAVIKFQEKYKKDILEPQNLEKGTGDVLAATRKKLNEICFENPEQKTFLKFSLTTVNQPMLAEMASFLKSQWEALGAEVELQIFDTSTSESELKFEREVIKPRNYEALLFGEVLGAVPDPFPFWHSSQKKDPGLNLAMYENKKSDKLLEEARESLDSKEKLEEFQNILIEDAPAVFLYNPDYLYLVSKKIKGIDAKMIVDPSKRFVGIENWYIKTKRVWR